MNSEHVVHLQRMANESWRGSSELAALVAAIVALSTQQDAPCAGCEGNPSSENTPCAVCGQQPAADGGFTAADMMVARQEGRQEAQQAAAVDDVMGDMLTEDQRIELVEALVADQVEGAGRVSLYLWNVLENGFKGYSNYTDQELLDAHVSAFDEDFLDLESGDDQ